MDEYKNGNLDNDENIESENINGHATDDSNTQKSGAEDARELFGEEENNGIEKENDDSQGQNDSEKAEAGAAGSYQTDADEIEPAGYVWNSGEGNTYHFKPENMKEYLGQGTYSYKSSFETTEPDHESGKENKKKKNKKKERKEKRQSSPKAYLFWLIPVVVLSSLVMGIAGGLLVGSFFTADAEPDFVDTTIINMHKNEAPVDVEVIVSNESGKELSVAQVAELVSDAVVEVSTSSVVRDSFFGNYVVSGAGSGVVIAQTEEYAYIVTNYHVIEGANEVVVTATDGSEYKAEYLDGDASMDIAMIRIQPDKEFPKIVCGSSSAMKVGEGVVAIGNPLGQLGGTVTNGIVSALDRRIEVDGTTMVLMQTNAAVNPGNSGGGLFNMAGELIGIVNAKESATGVEGLGFAIPIDRVYDTLVEIIENKYIHGRPTLDIEVDYVSDLWEAIRKYGVNTTGVFVTSSNNSEIHVNDIINSINGELITDEASYAAAINDLEVGETVTVELYRASDDRRWYKQTVEVEVKEYVPTGIFG